MTEESEYVTLEEAMDMIRASEDEIRELIGKKELRSKQDGNILKVNRHDLETLDRSKLPTLKRIKGEI
jgi:hypothetical protein